MPKGFTEREKLLIREKLFEVGTKLFQQYGIQKTTVDEIAKAASISKGSFYSFYGSKEELFFDILESLDKETKKKLSDYIFPENKPYEASFRELLYGLFDIIRNTAILSKINPAELEHLMRKLPEEKTRLHISNDNRYFAGFFTEWKKTGVFRDIDPKAFTGLLKLLFYFVLHQAEFAPDEFEATKILIIDMFCGYLINDNRDREGK